MTFMRLPCAGGADVTLRPASLSYLGQWDRPGNSSLMNLSLASNLPGGKNGRQSDFTANRLNATEHYTIARANLVHTSSFAGDWQVRVLGNAQYTRDALVAGEQLGMAGSTAVRGFYERVVTADKGFYATMEVYSPDLAPMVKASGNLRVLGFYDFAAGSFNKTAPGVYSRAHIASAGLGLRYSLGQNASIKADIARVTDGGPKDTATAGDWRGHVGLVIGF